MYFNLCELERLGEITETFKKPQNIVNLEQKFNEDFMDKLGLNQEWLSFSINLDNCDYHEEKESYYYDRISKSYWSIEFEIYVCEDCDNEEISKYFDCNDSIVFNYDLISKEFEFDYKLEVIKEDINQYL